MVTETQLPQTTIQQQQQQQINNLHQTSGHHHQNDGVASFLRAARSGNLDKVLEYLKGSFDINTCNANGLNALHLASKEGHVGVVTELLRRGAKVNTATKKGNTALHIASLAGQDEVVKVLVSNGANVNVQSVNGFTPLYMAAQENHDNVVRYLLANGANQSLATEDGFTPLAVALQQGHDRVVAVLLENDTKGKVRLPALHVAAKKDDCKAATLLLQNDHNPDVTSKSGFTPLHIAAHYGNENISALLLEKNADVNYAAKHQITPLHVASKWGKVNMVSLLLDYKARIDSPTQDGLTPLHCSARSGHKSVVELLLARGAPISSKTKNGLAPLHMAAQGDHVDCTKVLLDHRAPVDDVTVDYLTPLHVASHCGHVRVAKLLLERKADPNARALNGFTPLHIACKKNRIKVVELLLKHGASIEATTESGLTPLHVASFMGCMNIVIYLIQHMANPDVQTIRGETPLHLAARANQTDIIRVLLRNGAQVDSKARENQTPLHIASRLGNADIVSLLIQHGASVDAVTKDQYTPLHIATKDGQEETVAVLLDNGASLTAQTKKGFTPLHLAAKYGNMKVARQLISRKAPVNAQGKNNVTPLHCAAHYDHVNIALLLLEEKASPHSTAKNGYTPLHIAARKNQIDIATTLLEYTANPNAESKAGFTPLHLASQEGHTDMVALLIQHHSNVNAKSKNGLTPMHLCAQNDRVNVASILAKNNADISPQTKEGYTPLHAAAHFGQINMVRFLLKNGANVNKVNCHGYTPLHQAAQQGHVHIVNLLLDNKASPNVTTNQGQTALSIAQKLGYISVIETLKTVTTETTVATKTTVVEEKYKLVAPEVMHESFMSDSEDEAAEELLGDNSYRYLTGDEMKFLGDDSLPIDVTKDERMNETFGRDSLAPITIDEELLSPQYFAMTESYVNALPPDNIALSKVPINHGPLKWKNFLVSFMVDARGGAMRGCRHSGVRVIIPPRKAAMPMRITCRYMKREKLAHPPVLMEGEACASRILEMGPSGAKFLGPVIIEVPHFASLRGKEREIVIFRSDNGETWREHTLEATEEAVLEVLNASFEGENETNNGLDDFSNNRITRILTTDFPQYFAIITRIRQEVHAIGPEGGILSSTVVPQVQAIFPEGALTKKIKVGLQAQPIPNELVTKLLGNRIAVSPICTIEPRRRKFHKPITLTVPLPQAANRGMINQYSVDTPTLRLLCSITGGSAKAQWEDVTGSTPLTFVNSCVSFTTTVSARFWLIDCREINNATKYANELYQESVNVPFMAKFVLFAKRFEPNESQIRVFCMTDDKEDKTLENQENFVEIAKSRDVEVLESKAQFFEFAGNLTPVTKSGEQLYLVFNAFRENRLPFIARVKDPQQDPSGRIAFMRDSRKIKYDQPQQPICTLNMTLPEIIPEESYPIASDSKPFRQTKSAHPKSSSSTKLSKEILDHTFDNTIDNSNTVSSQSMPHSNIVGKKQPPSMQSNSPDETKHKIPMTNGFDVQPVVAPVQEKNFTKESAPGVIQSAKKESIQQSPSIDDQIIDQTKSIKTNLSAKTSPKSPEIVENILDKKQTKVSNEEKIVEQLPVKDVVLEPQKNEFETWQSVEQDTSQLSFSDLPEDEKSEPSVTISSANDNVARSDDPKIEKIVKKKECVEEGKDGVIRKHVQQSSIQHQKEPDHESVVVYESETVSSKLNNNASITSKSIITMLDENVSNLINQKPSLMTTSSLKNASIISFDQTSETIQTKSDSKSPTSLLDDDDDVIESFVDDNERRTSKQLDSTTDSQSFCHSNVSTVSIDECGDAKLQQKDLQPREELLKQQPFDKISESKIDLDNIKLEAISITNSIMERARDELRKKSLCKKKQSIEISDEDMVERDENELEMIKQKLQSNRFSSIEEIQDSSTGPLSTPPPTSSSMILSSSQSKSEMIKQGLQSRISPQDSRSKIDAKDLMFSSTESSLPYSDVQTSSSSRPISGDFDAILMHESGGHTNSSSHLSSEYVTCPMAKHSSSFHTIPTSLDTSQYFTPPSGKTSSTSFETGSSSNLGEISETSETLHENVTLHSDDDNDGNYFDEQYKKISEINTDEIEPFNCPIASSVLQTDNWPSIKPSVSEEKENLDPSISEQPAESYTEEEEFFRQQAAKLYQPSIPAACTLESIDKNLYTHVEVEEENDDSLSLERKSSQKTQSISLISPKKNVNQWRNLNTETETTSSTSSSLREFERLECEVADQRYETKSMQENLELLYDPEETNESLNSEFSQDTITCIRTFPNESVNGAALISNDDNIKHQNGNQPFSSSTAMITHEFFPPQNTPLEPIQPTQITNQSSSDIGQCLMDTSLSSQSSLNMMGESEAPIMVQSLQGESRFSPIEYHQQEQQQNVMNLVDSSLSSNQMGNLDFNSDPILDCDFTSLHSNSTFNPTTETTVIDNRIELHCDEPIQNLLLTSTATSTTIQSDQFIQPSPSAFGDQSGSIITTTSTTKRVINERQPADVEKTIIMRQERKSSTSSSSSSSSSLSSTSSSSSSSSSPSSKTKNNNLETNLSLLKQLPE